MIEPRLVRSAAYLACGFGAVVAGYAYAAGSFVAMTLGFTLWTLGFLFTHWT